MVEMTNWTSLKSVDTHILKFKVCEEGSCQKSDFVLEFKQEAVRQVIERGLYRSRCRQAAGCNSAESVQVGESVLGERLGLL